MQALLDDIITYFKLIVNQNYDIAFTNTLIITYFKLIVNQNQDEEIPFTDEIITYFKLIVNQNTIVQINLSSLL